MFSGRKSVITAIVILLAGVAGAVVMVKQKEPMRMGKGSDGPRTINTMMAERSDFVPICEAGAAIVASEKIELYAEVTGVLQSSLRPFKEGQVVGKGEVLLSIDDTVYRHNLLAEKSSLLSDLMKLLSNLRLDYPESVEPWTRYLNEYDIEAPLKPLPEPTSTRERNYLAAQNIYTRYHAIKAMESTWDKYRIVAPFNGVITQAELNAGTLVRTGQKLGEFSNLGKFELAAPVPLDAVREVTVGDPVELYSNDITGRFRGVVARINSNIDRESQTVKVYILIEDNRLRDGMYLTAVLEGHPIPDVVALPREVLDKDGRFYVIRDSVLVGMSAEVEYSDRETVYLSNLENGTIVPLDRIDGARDGMKVDRYAVSEGL